MNLRWAALGMVAGLLAGCAAGNAKTADPAMAASGTGGAQPEAQRLEKFAISQCLMRAFPDTPMAADARRASGAYVELGSAEADVYGEIVAVVNAHRAKPYQSKSGESLRVMQCLDLLADPALADLVRPYR